MGTASSKSDGCLMLMCVRDDEDKAYNVDPEHAAVPIIKGSLQQEDIGRMDCEVCVHGVPYISFQLCTRKVCIRISWIVRLVHVVSVSTGLYASY